MTARSADILCANLDALRKTDAALADRINRTAPGELEFRPSKAGPLSATVRHRGRSLTLASRYDPHLEAQKMVASIDYSKAACVVLLGMGLGYHVAQVVQRLGPRGLLLVFEPDVTLLRAVFERIDHTAWLGQGKVMLCDDTLDRPTLTTRLEPHAGLITQGMLLICHPPSRTRYPKAFEQFSQIITDTLAYCRTNVATALVNSARTCRNLACNLPHYAAGATTDELHNATHGYPAVCVGAGPSLVRNVDLLRDPHVRRRVVLISAQTTLKPLLDRSIQPDFVTALDYSPISQRFYEDLPDLPQVTLIAEPMAHATILDCYPGPVRTTGASFNDLLLGDLARPRIPLTSGATVAHLSFYVAQHLGCDPIILIGQDLGFTDGLYYAPGTAVHGVWSSELNSFNTLEMMEWQRIARHKTHLQKLQDCHGKSIYSDEQMLTYLKQFERDFATAGQRILDATEGGLPKAHTTLITLAEALAKHATRPVPELPIPPRRLDPKRLASLLDLLEQRLGEVTELQDTARATMPLLRQMRKHQCDRGRMEKLFKKLRQKQYRVETELKNPFNLVNAVNAIGAFKRARTDRAIWHKDTDQLQRQSRQIDRDLENLDWLMQGCDETLSIFREARQRVIDGLQRTRSEQKHSRFAAA